MDTSNPIISSDKMTVGQALERLKKRRRQDIAYLEELVRTAPRATLPTGDLIPETEAKLYVQEYKKKVIQVSQNKEKRLPMEVLDLMFNEVPVCGVLNGAGIPLHPPHLNNRAGKLSVNRQMGGVPHPPLGLPSMAKKLGQLILDQKYVYTGGTWEGFVKRLHEQMGRKTVPLVKTFSELGKDAPHSALIKELDKYMPRRPNHNWPGVHTDPYEGITEGIKITSKSSAGAPYWRNKGECLDDILDVGLPIVIGAIKDGTLGTLWKTNPEMFLCEVKNKMDRYEITKLQDKTRPYVCVPAHWAFLFSCLAQGFQETLWVFSQTGSPPDCSNAYGFSSVNGGLSRFVEWMHGATNRGRVVCYGDDACIVFKKNGQTYRVDPDFKQMDGSLNRDDIRLTIEWILSHLAKDLGVTQAPPFWVTVAHVWLDMATDPRFVIDGTGVYKKKQPHGLMTGVPGTTLFDTVKSILAWNRLLDVAPREGIDLLNETQVTKWMAKQGLVIKEGTWKPSPIPPPDQLGLVTDHKFLGVQIKLVEFQGRRIHIPTIPLDEAVQMLLCQKDNPFTAVRTSNFADQRTLFDRMRGLMITFGFDIPLIRETIHTVVNELPGSVIIMQTQNPNGSRPEHITLQEFDYPDSSGFPSMEFCYNLYSDVESDDGWVQMYPTLLSFISESKREYRREGRFALAVAQPRPEGPERVIRQVEPPPPPLNEEYRSFDALKPTTVSLQEAPNPRSKIQVVHPDRTEERKRIPTLGESIILYLNTIGGISQLGTVQDRFPGLTPTLCAREAQRYGFFTTGLSPGDLVSLYPVTTPFPTIQDDQIDELERSRNLINTGATTRKEALKKPPVATQPEMVFMDTSRLMGCDHKGRVKDASEAHAILNNFCHRKFMGMQWKSLLVDPGKENPVGVQLLTLANHITPQPLKLAEAWSASLKMAKEYIASTFLQLNGIIQENARHYAPILPPPPDTAPWRDLAEFEASPLAQPVYQDINHPLDWQLVANLKEEFPDLSLSTITCLVLQAQKGGGNYQLRARNHLLRTQEMRQGQPRDAPFPSPPSRRGKFSSEKRARLNRKTLERRKKRLQAARSAPPQHS